MRILRWPLIFIFAFSQTAVSAEIVVHYLRAYDGDTIYVDLPELKKMDKKKNLEVFWHELPVRIGGIDTPEIRGKCPNEIELAKSAKRLIHDILSHANQVTIENADRDKYFRLLGDVLADGVSVAQILLDAKLAVPYDGGTKNDIWCQASDGHLLTPIDTHILNP